MKSQMQNQEPHAEHHFADFFESLLIWGSIGWPLKCKLMGFFGHMLLSRAPPPCVVLCQGPEVNFPGHPRVTKLFCIGSPLNRSQSLTYCTLTYVFKLATGDRGAWCTITPIDFKRADLGYTVDSTGATRRQFILANGSFGAIIVCLQSPLLIVHVITEI